MNKMVEIQSISANNSLNLIKPLIKQQARNNYRNFNEALKQDKKNVSFDSKREIYKHQIQIQDQEPSHVQEESSNQKPSPDLEPSQNQEPRKDHDPSPVPE